MTKHVLFCAHCQPDNPFHAVIWRGLCCSWVLHPGWVIQTDLRAALRKHITGTEDDFEEAINFLEKCRYLVSSECEGQIIMKPLGVEDKSGIVTCCPQHHFHSEYI